MSNNLPILMVSVNDRCYASYRFFARELARALEKMGQSIRWCYLPPEQTRSDTTQAQAWEKLLDEVVGEQYLAVIDFNSFLPKLQVGEHSLPELFGAPFYHYILDHPLYHHKALGAKGFDQRLICVDAAHEQYIRKWYPQIHTVMTHGIAASAGRCAEKEFAMRRRRILFCGTYEPSEKYLNLIKELPDMLKKENLYLIGRLYAEPELTMEEALAQMGQTHNFASRMQADFLVDAYLRAKRREDMLGKIAEAGLPLTIYGQGWEQFAGLQSAEAEVRGAVSYEEFVDLTGEYQFVLNCMPCFTQGGHDRIVQAMRNGAVCITDENQYVRAHYKNGGHLLSFSLREPERLAPRCEEALQNPERMSLIAQTGREYAMANHSWGEIAKAILRDVKSPYPKQ